MQGCGICVNTGILCIHDIQGESRARDPGGFENPSMVR